MSTEVKKHRQMPSLSEAVEWGLLGASPRKTPLPSVSNTPFQLSAPPSPVPHRPSPLLHIDIASRIVNSVEKGQLPTVMQTCPLAYDLAGRRLYKNLDFTKPQHPFIGVDQPLPPKTIVFPDEPLLGLSEAQDEPTCPRKVVQKGNRKNELLLHTEVVSLVPESHIELDEALRDHGTRLPSLHTVFHTGWDCGMQHSRGSECRGSFCDDENCQHEPGVVENCEIWKYDRPVHLVIETDAAQLEDDETDPSLMTFHPSIKKLTILWSPPLDLTALTDYEGIIRNVPDTVEEFTVVFLPTKTVKDHKRWDWHPRVGNSMRRLCLHLSDIGASYAKKVSIVGTEQFYNAVGSERWIEKQGWSVEDLEESTRQLLITDQEDFDQARLSNIRFFQDKLKFMTMYDWLKGLTPDHVLKERSSDWIVPDDGHHTQPVEVQEALPAPIDGGHEVDLVEPSQAEPDRNDENKESKDESEGVKDSMEIDPVPALPECGPSQSTVTRP